MNFMKREKYVAPMIYILMTEELCSDFISFSVNDGDKNVDKGEVHEEHQSEELFDNTDNWGGC